MTVAATIAQSKYFRLIVGVIVLTIFLVTLMAAAHKQSSSPIAGMQVVLNSDVEYTVLEQQDLVQLLLQNNSINLKESSLDKLDLKLMEQVARTHPWVADANIFVDGKRQLQVHVRQREPVARIFDNNGRTYYLDQQMHEMPNLVGYNYPVPVFTKVPLWVKDSLNQSFREQIIALGSLIHADSFWNAQVTQIEVQADRTFILIPMVGDQRILFGDTSNAQAKLNNLYDFYQQVSNTIGWDKYQVLDLRFNNQIVATPSIGWVAPKVLDTTMKYLPPVVGDTIVSTIQKEAPEKSTAAHNPKTEQKKSSAQVQKTSNSTKRIVDSKKESLPTSNKQSPTSKTPKTSSDTKKKENPKYLYRGNNQ